MNQTYRLALTGTLTSQPQTQEQRSAGPVMRDSQIINETPIPILVKHINSLGKYDNSFTIDANSTKEIVTPRSAVPYATNDSFIVFSKDTGAFMTVIDPSEGPTETSETDPLSRVFRVKIGHLSMPGDIGPLPLPTEAIPIPPDSEHVVVGCSQFNNEVTIIREQYWKRLEDSYSLAPQEHRTIGTSVSFGKQTTSSTEASFTTNLGLDASVGWGPISASLSASLGSNTTTFQQVIVTETSTTYLSSTLKNDSPRVQIFFHWQLTDVITMVKDNKAVAVLISGESPVLTRKYEKNR